VDLPLDGRTAAELPQCPEYHWAFWLLLVPAVAAVLGFVIMIFVGLYMCLQRGALHFLRAAEAAVVVGPPRRAKKVKKASGAVEME